jgi:hypothetical protein
VGRAPDLRGVQAAETDQAFASGSFPGGAHLTGSSNSLSTRGASRLCTSSDSRYRRHPRKNCGQAGTAISGSTFSGRRSIIRGGANTAHVRCCRDAGEFQRAATQFAMSASHWAFVHVYSNDLFMATGGHQFDSCVGKSPSCDGQSPHIGGEIPTSGGDS